MDDLIVYLGLPDLILALLCVITIAGFAGWWVGRRKSIALARQQAELLEALPQGVMIVRCDGRVVQANAEARQLWGQAVAAQLEGEWLALCRETFSVGVHQAQTLAAPSGLSLSVHSAPLHPDSILLLLQDLSARQRQEAFYRNFISNVSHELKTPLTVIQGHVAAMDQPADEERWRTSRRIVSEETARLTQLVDNLLLLSRLELPDFALDLSLVSLEAVIEDAILQLSDLAEARRVSINLLRENALPRLMADRARLKQVFLNLLDNAIKYNREGGQISVRLGAEANRVRVQVTDTGEGIPSKDLPHIFEKLYRVERRRGRPVEGSGLGLSIVKRIVEQHGGSLSVASREGETTLTVDLPVRNMETV